MAILLIVLLVAGYAWSVWLLWRQMHFELPSGTAPLRSGESPYDGSRWRADPMVGCQRHLRRSSPGLHPEARV